MVHNHVTLSKRILVVLFFFLGLAEAVLPMHHDEGWVRVRSLTFINKVRGKCQLGALPI
jgi:hypothetical protein